MENLELRLKVIELIPKQKDIAKEINIEPGYFNKWIKGRVELGPEKLWRVNEWVKSKEL